MQLLKPSRQKKNVRRRRSKRPLSLVDPNCSTSMRMVCLIGRSLLIYPSRTRLLSEESR